MTGIDGAVPSRRAFLAGTAATVLLALPGCTGMGGISFTEAIRRLLTLSTQNAFSLLTAPGGFWDREVARLALPDVFSGRGTVLQNILTSSIFRDRLQHQLNIAAERGAYRAAPIVAETVRTIGIDNAVALIRGGPTAATEFLRGRMAGSLVEAMVPELGSAMRVASDPILGQAIGALTGIDLNGVASRFALDVDNGIWGEIGRQEADIRAHPEKTNDALLIAALKVL